MNELFIQFTRFSIGTVAPWFATGLLICLGTLILRALPTLIAVFRSYHRTIQIGLVLTIVIGAVIRFAWVPVGHRIFFDEDRYLSYAVNFARHGKALSLMLVSPDGIRLGDPDPAARITVPVINAWALKILGYSESVLFSTALIWSVAQIAIIFIACVMLLDDPWIGLFAAIVFALSPISVYWSVSTNIDVYFVTFALLALIGSIAYARTRSIQSMLFFWAATSLLLMVRFESFLVLPSLFLAIWGVRHRAHMPLLSRSDIPIGALLIPMILLRAIVSVPVFGSIWCCAEATPIEIFTTSYVMRNTIPNLLTFVSRPEFPPFLSILAAISLLSIRSSRKTVDFQLLVLLSWLFCFFFIYSFYYAGQYYSYTFSGSYGRFFLMETVPITLLAGMAIRRFSLSFAKGSYTQRNVLLACLILIGLSLIPTIASYRRLITISPWDTVVEAGPRKIHSYIDTVMIPNTPPESAHIFGILAPIHLYGKTAIYTDLFYSDDRVISFVQDYLRSGKPVFMFETHTCDIYPEKCAKILKLFRFESYAPSIDPNFPGMELKQLKLKES